MEPLEVSLIVIAVVGMAFSAGSCMLSPKRPLSVGFLNLIAGALTIFTGLSLYSGDLVLAPEFGAVMVQGSGAIWTLRIALIGITLLPTLCYFRIRQLNDWPTHLWPWLLSGILVGVWAATRLRLLNPDDASAIHVHIYDVWWPPLVLWLAACLVRIMLALGKIERKGIGIVLTLALVPLMARFALASQELSDPQSREWWRLIEPSALMLCLLWVAHRFLSFRNLQAVKRFAALAGFAIVAIGAGFLFDLAPGGAKLGIEFVPLLTLLGLVLLPPLAGAVIPNALQPVSSPRFPFIGWLLQNALSSVQHASVQHATGLFFSVAILIIPICFVDLVSVGAVDRSIDLGLITLFWLGFSARLSEDVLRTLPAIFKQGVLQFSALTAIGEKLAPAIKPIWQSAANIAKAFTAGTNWAIAFRGFILTGLALLGLIAVNEALNYHKLIVEPFVWKGGEDDKENKEKVADRVSEGIVNALGAMRAELSPVLLITAPAAHGTTAHLEPAVLDSGALQTVGSKSSDLEIWKIKIPISLLIEPIQGIMRNLLDIHSAGGTIHRSSDGTLVLLIHTDNGETSKLTPDLPAVTNESPLAESKTATPAPPMAPTVSTAAATPSGERSSAASQTLNNSARGQTGNNLAAVNAGDTKAESDVEPSEAQCEAEKKETDPVEMLIDKAAFRIANSDSSFAAMGLTKNWKAYTFFRSGLHRWDCFQSYQHQADLHAAIRYFRQSAEEDSSFAAAFYRLGIALQSAGDLDSAVLAFKQSIDANPDFVQAQTAQAQALSHYNDMREAFYRPAIADFPEWMDRSSEARKIWAGIVALAPTAANQLDKTSAFFGLCVDGYYLSDSKDTGANKFYKNYFFCSKAEAMFRQMPASVRNQLQQKQLEASTLFFLGEFLNYNGYKIRPLRKKPPTSADSAGAGPVFWHCSASAVDEEDLKKRFTNDPPKNQEDFNTRASESVPLAQGSVHTAHALRFYGRSLALIPDDIVVQCSDAAARAYLTGQAWEAMKQLAASPEAHLALANDFDEKAARLDHKADAQSADFDLALLYYRLALREYGAAVDLSPTSYAARNGFATVVWHWFLDSSSKGSMMSPPGFDDEWAAEGDALQAVELSQRRDDLNAQTDARDTLGEILLTQGRNEEALKTMQTVVHELENRNYDAYGANELKWDYAQSLLCDSTTGHLPVDERDDIQKASENYSQIKKNEEGSELKPFSRTKGAFDPSLHQQWCVTAPDIAGDADSELALHNITYSPQPGCAKVTLVEGRLEGEENDAGFRLVVYGPGVTEPAAISPETIQLVPPLHEHHMYFGQFRNESGTVFSPIVSFDAPNDISDPTCPHGRIILNFKRKSDQPN